MAGTFGDGKFGEGTFGGGTVQLPAVIDQVERAPVVRDVERRPTIHATPRPSVHS